MYEQQQPFHDPGALVRRKGEKEKRHKVGRCGKVEEEEDEDVC